MALAAPLGASSLKNRHFVGTLTVTEHRVWNYSSSSVDEHGLRNITAQAEVDLEVSPSGSIVGFHATGVSLHGSMHLLEEIHPSSCDITTSHMLNGGGSFSISGSLTNFVPGWPLENHQVDVGECPGEPSGTTDYTAQYGPTACTTSDDGADGTVTYNSVDKPPFGTGGVGSATTYTCKGTLKAKPLCPVFEVPKTGSDFVVGTVIEVRLLDSNSGDEPVAYITHGRHAREPLQAGDSVRQGDIISTGTNTVLEFSLAIGGRVGVNTNAKIEVTGPRTVKDVSGNITVSIPSILNKLNCAKFREPIEIQENGGVTGQKG